MQKIFWSLTILFCSFAGAAETPSELTETVKKSYVSPLQGGLDLSYSPLTYKSYHWGNELFNRSKGHSLRLAMEWIPFGDIPYGKPVAGVATGFNWIRKADLGNGESASLYAIPLAPYLGYRLDYFTNQFLIPYGKLGLNYTYSYQDTTGGVSGKRVNERSYLGFEYALGLEICLNVIDPRSVRTLDSYSGINGVFLFAEYTKSNQIVSDWADLSHEEVQLGMRFEF